MALLIYLRFLHFTKFIMLKFYAVAHIKWSKHYLLANTIFKKKPKLNTEFTFMRLKIMSAKFLTEFMLISLNSLEYL